METTAWPSFSLPIRPPFEVMEAKLVESVPDGQGWQLEPKWDGFRCLAYKEHDQIALQSKGGQPLGRYFPEMVEDLSALPIERLVLDGELAVPVPGGFSFEALLQRIHPAQSRIARLAQETPSVMLAFDVLVDPAGRDVRGLPLAERRALLETLARELFPDGGRIRLTPQTRDRGEAERWLQAGQGVDGLMAKRLDQPYRSGERSAMQKVKRARTADCVVGGFRWAKGERGVGSLLLGLYDRSGRLHYVGHAAAFTQSQRWELVKLVEPLVGEPGFTGSAPGGPSRWARGRSTEWVPLRPALVVEVAYHHASGGRFRHGTDLVRFRPDKAPAQCTFEQVGWEPEAADAPSPGQPG